MASNIKYFGEAALEELIVKIVAADAALQSQINTLDSEKLEGVTINGTALSVSSNIASFAIKQDGTNLTVTDGAVNVNVVGTKVNTATAADYVGSASGSAGAGTRFSASDIKAIKDKADGLSTSYAISYSGTGDASHTVINSQFDSTNDGITVSYSLSDKKYIKTSSGVYVDIGDLQIGDAVYLTNADKPDRWVSAHDTTVSPASITFSVLEAKLTGYVAGDNLTANTVILGNGGSTIKTSSKTIAPSSTTLASSDDTLPTSKAVKDYVDSITPSVAITKTDPVVVTDNSSGTSKSFNISLATAYGDTQNPYAAKAKNTVLAGPDGTSGHTANAVPTFRALHINDIPSLSSLYIPKSGGGTITSASTGTTRNNITDTGMQLFSGSSGAPYTQYGIDSITRQGSEGPGYSINLPSTSGTLAVINDIPTHTAITASEVDALWATALAA